jgi:transposase
MKVGEPQCPVAAVERGKQVLVSKDKKLTVADHDFTRLTLTPSVAMIIDVPESIEGSFYRGIVFVLFKENAFQPSSPRRHMAELKNILQRLGPVKPILVLYTDGGPDHRLTYLSVQLSQISLWLNLDFLCAVHTPPQHSWKNPVERIMSIIKPMTELLSTLIQRLKLKEHNFESQDAASVEDIDVLWKEVLKVTMPTE